MPRKGQTEGEICGFIQKLWDILQNPDFHKILLWNNCGKSFAILNSCLLESDILPSYFRHSKLKSFIRQLNMYDFKKSQRDKELLVFFNHNFRRNEQDKLPLIRRKLSKRVRRQRRIEENRPQGYAPHQSPNDLSLKEHIIPDSKDLPSSQIIRQQPHHARSVLEIKSYGRLIEDCSNLIPFISPYSYASIKSQKQVVVEEESEGRSFIDLQFFKNGSTNADDVWGTGFTSCQYFI